MWVLLTAAIVIAVIVILAQPVSGHTGDDIDTWLTEWTATADAGLTLEHLTKLADFEARHRWFFSPPESTRKEEVAGRNPNRDSMSKAPLAPAALRGLVALYFPPENVDAAMSVMWCESRYNPNAKNPRSSASGLFQHLARYWPGRSAAAGWAGADIFDPEANIAVAAWLSDGGRDWGHWVCKP